MTNVFKTPLAKELDEIKRKLVRRKRSQVVKEIREFILLVAAIVLASGVYDLLTYILKALGLLK